MPEISKELLMEKALLFTCREDKGFYIRLLSFTKKLRIDEFIGEIIREWEQGPLKEMEHLKNQAYRELSKAFFEVKQVLEGLEKRGTLIFSKDSKLSAIDELVSDICSSGSFLNCRLPPYERVYYKLKTLYINLISKSYESEFAPSALAMIENDKTTNFLANADCHPAYLWHQLIFLEQALEIAGQRNSIGWPEILANHETMWLEADRAFRVAFRNYTADALWSAHDSNCRIELFCRINIQQLINRLMNELSLALSMSTQNKKGDARIRKSKADRKNLIPFAKKQWLTEFKNCQHPHPIKLEDMATKLIASLPDDISLQTTRPVPRAIKALKETDPRLYSKKGGKCLGFKPHWQQFDWVNT